MGGWESTYTLRLSKQLLYVPYKLAGEKIHRLIKVCHTDVVKTWYFRKVVTFTAGPTLSIFSLEYFLVENPFLHSLHSASPHANLPRKPLSLSAPSLAVKSIQASKEMLYIWNGTEFVDSGQSTRIRPGMMGRCQDGHGDTTENIR